MTISNKPTEADVTRVAERYLGGKDFRIQRFPTGLCHYVYQVTTKAGSQIVIRMGHEDTRQHLVGSVYWSERLASLRLPIAQILSTDLAAEFPYTILERLPGTDLGAAYTSLTSTERNQVACELTAIQAAVSRIPPPTRYGFGFSLDDQTLKTNWSEVVLANLQRTRSWIPQNEEKLFAYVGQVQRKVVNHSEYLDSLPPTPFLHDTTTKNVLVHDRKLSGIVDIDDLCFGDPIFVVALTNVALLSARQETDYVDYWMQALRASENQWKMLRLYSCVFTVNFMGEAFQRFNRDKASGQDRLLLLESILQSHLKALHE